MASQSEKVQKLKNEDVLKILDAGGPLERILKGFEPRSEQREMMHHVLNAYNEDSIALIEAGTGTGKSLAYLIPAMLWALKAKERTIISTNTIPLQEQLLQKDIPLIARALNIELKAFLVKGMHNYLCLRNLEESQQEILLLPPQIAEELQKIEAWSSGTHDGSRSSLPFSISSAAWDKVSAESDTCTRTNCPFYQKCHFFKARRQAAEAQILVVNHHLLFADLACRLEHGDQENKEGVGILPPYHRIILDEAHHIEDVATEYFASEVNQMNMIRLIARLSSEKGEKIHGKLPLIKEKLSSAYRNELPKQATSIFERLTVDFPGLRRDVLQRGYEAFQAFFEFALRKQQKKYDGTVEDIPGENKLRILSTHLEDSFWKERLIPSSRLFIDSMKRYSQALRALDVDFKQLDHPLLNEQIKGTLFEIQALAERLENLGIVLENFISEQIPVNKVRWIELQVFKAVINTCLIDADLDISKMLSSSLFNKMSTAVLCSATLASNRQFDFIRQRLGLTEELLDGREVKEFIFNSPFDYQKQALLAIPTDLPSPSDAAFIQEASEKIFSILQCSRGNAFILFTSYSMLKACYTLLEPRLKQFRFHALKQGDGDRNFLLKQFKSQDRSVLFGTDSFWEGVDVAGEALRCVIIVKLPFKVPSDPLFQARSESLQVKGRDPFSTYSLPQAIVKFKQGFGRLIRQRRDRGCVVCLDKRLVEKGYGKLFLNSLPECRFLSASMEEILKEMTAFFRSTHYLTKQ